MQRVFSTFVLICAAAFLGFWVRSYWNPGNEEAAESRETIEQNTPSVITQIRGLSRIEGAEFHMERIIDLRERQSLFHGLIEAEDALLLVAAGSVVAGVDLGGLVETDIQASADSRTVAIRLPRARVLSAHLDSSRTYVHSRETDVLATRQENLETKARARAEATLQQAAIEGGILIHAEENVRKTLTLFLESLGFDKVQVTFRPAAQRRER